MLSMATGASEKMELRPAMEQNPVNIPRTTAESEGETAPAPVLLQLMQLLRRTLFRRRISRQQMICIAIFSVLSMDCQTT